MENEFAMNLSKEENNRIHIWHRMLEKAYDYLIINETIEYSSQAKLQYFIGPKIRTIATELTIKSALKESAIICFCNIITTGNEGIGIANNNDDTINRFRDKMFDFTFEKLAWHDKRKFDKLIKKIKSNRNQFIAHYDASKAKYEELTNVQRMLSPEIHLNDDEISDLKCIIKFMIEFIYLSL